MTKYQLPFLKQCTLALVVIIILIGGLLAATLPPRPVQGDSIVQAPVVTASSFTPGHEAYHAIDGDPATFWQSAEGAAFPQWIQLDLGGVHQLNQLSYWPRQGGEAGRVVNYAVLLSLDGNTFFTVTQGTWATATVQTVVFPLSSARYVRLKALTAYGGERVAVAGLSVRRSLDLAPVLVASALSEHPGYEASNALDNNPATFWHSEWADGRTLPQWLQVDMGEAYTIDQLSYQPRQDQENGRIAVYAVLLSLDGSTFFTATQGTWPNATGGQTARFAASEARYVRLVALDAHGTASVASVAGLSVQHTEIDAYTAHWTAQASSVQPGFDASHALDGDLLTYWQSTWVTATDHLSSPAAPPIAPAGLLNPASRPWIQLDLGDIHQINHLAYWPRQDRPEGRIAAYAVLLSVDDSTFFTATQGTWPVDSRSMQTATFPPFNARYVRLVARSGYGGCATAAQIRAGNGSGTTILSPKAEALSHAGYEGYYAVDSDPTTFWQGAPAGTTMLPQALDLDLGAAYRLGQFSYLPRLDQEDGRIKAYTILGSLDGTAFFTLTQGTWSNTAALQAARLPSVEVRYVRLLARSTYGLGDVAASAAEISVQGGGSIADAFWGSTAPASALSVPNDQIINMPGPVYTHTYRIYVKPEQVGSLDWRVWFGNQVDNGPVDGNLHGYGINGGRTARTDEAGGSWRILSAYVADGGTEPDGSIAGEPIAVTFQGMAEKHVQPLERFWSDPASLTVPKGHYLAFSWTVAFGGGKTLPFSLQHQDHSYWKAGDYAYQADNAGFQLAKAQLAYAVAPNLFAYERGAQKRIGFLGDSVTQGFWGEEDFWVAEISEGLGSDYAVWNLGSGFGHAYDAAAKGVWLDKAVLNDTLAICLGVNDIAQRRTAEQLLADLASAIGEIKRRDPDITIILFTVPPFNFSGEKEGMWRAVNEAIRSNAKTLLGADYVFDIAAVLGQDLPNDHMIIPDYAANPDPDNPIATDYHPNTVGSRAIAEAFLAWYEGVVLHRGTPAQTLYAVSAVSTSAGHAVGDAGTILRYQGGALSNGQAWQQRASPTAHALYGLSADAQVAVGEGGMILSRFEDYHLVPWYKETSPTSQTLYAVAMLSALSGQAVGEDGIILSRVDGGPWAVATSPTTRTLYGLSMFSPDCGVAVGEAGTILCQCDGQPWQVEPSPTTHTLYAVAMASDVAAKAVGEGGVILSRAGDQTWQAETSPTTHTLYAVTLLPGEGYWAVGEGGVILQYPFEGPEANGWQLCPPPTDRDLYAVGSSPDGLWAVGACGVILQYEHEAEVWRLAVPPRCNGLYLPLVARRA